MPCDDADSAGPDARDFMVIGRIEKAHGVRGAVVVRSFSDVAGRFESLAGAYLRIQDRGPTWFEVETVAAYRAGYLVKFQGVDDRDQARALSGVSVELTTDASPPLEADEYYHHQVIGLTVVCEDGWPLGRLISIIETGANDVFVVESERGEEFLLPGTREVVRSIDPERGRMIIRPLPGLLDLASGGDD